MKGDYHTEIKLCTIVRRHTLGTNAAAQNGSQVLHIIVEKVNKLLLCPQRDCNAEIYKTMKRVIITLEKSHFGALLKFKTEVKFFTSL